MIFPSPLSVFCVHCRPRSTQSPRLTFVPIGPMKIRYLPTAVFIFMNTSFLIYIHKSRIIYLLAKLSPYTHSLFYLKHCINREYCIVRERILDVKWEPFEPCTLPDFELWVPVRPYSTSCRRPPGDFSNLCLCCIQHSTLFPVTHHLHRSARCSCMSSRMSIALLFLMEPMFQSLSSGRSSRDRFLCAIHILKFRIKV